MRRIRSVFAIAAAVYILGCRTDRGGKDPAIEKDVWLFCYDSVDVGLAKQWYNQSYDRSGWRITESGYWPDVNGQSYAGVGWYASTFQIADSSTPLSIFFGGIDDEGDVWVNGKWIGSHSACDESFYFDLHDLHQGSNNLVVRVINRGGPGGLYKPVQIVRPSEVNRLLKTKFADENARASADWVRDAVIYEVYLRSFSKEGTFRALEKKLPELQSLGVTVLWLMPINPVGELGRKGDLGSPYSIQDYYETNEEFGTLDNFKSLVASVHRLGMKIIIDLVANHTSWDSQLLTEHPEWFRKNREGAIVSPNADWTDVAQLDYGQHELRKYMIEMMRFWVADIGIDGYRCDVAELLPIDFWELARRELDKIKPVMMLAEGKKPELHLKAFDLTYSWNLYDILADVVDGGRTVKSFDNLLEKESLQYPAQALRLRFDTNHDKNAFDAPAPLRYTVAGAKTTAVLMFTFPGVPLIYNGEEVGNAKKLDLFKKVGIDWARGKEFRELYATLSRARREHSSLRRGGYRRIECSDSIRVYAFERADQGDRIIVVLNFSKESRNVTIVSSTNLVDFSTGKLFASDGKKVSLKLSPYGYFLLSPQQRTTQL